MTGFRVRYTLATKLVEVDRRGVEMLFQVLTKREEKNSVPIASNESFGKAHLFQRTRARCCPS